MTKKYNLISTLEIIQRDIQKKKLNALLVGLFSLFIAISFIPFLLWIIITFLQFSDLPIIDHQFIRHGWNSDLYLISFNLILIFYFSFTIKKPIYENESYKTNFYFSLFFLLISIFLSFLSSYNENSTLFVLLYILFFIITLFFISKTFFYKKHNQFFYENEDDYMGIYKGVIDDPFTIRDDLNRAKLSLNGISASFSFLLFIFEQAVTRITFFYSIYMTNKAIESAELFNYLLENNLESKNLDKYFSHYAKNILETIEYVIFDETIIFLEKGKIRELEIK